jgi:hypothetical protein
MLQVQMLAPCDYPLISSSGKTIPSLMRLNMFLFINAIPKKYEKIRGSGSIECS